MKRDAILSAYSTYISEPNARPVSLPKFVSGISLSESEFYDEFASFQAMDADILNEFVKNAIELTHEELEEVTTPKEMLITFYLTYAEVLKANRSLVKFILPTDKAELEGLKALKLSRETFGKFVDSLNIEVKALDFVPDHSIKSKALRGMAWLQFMSVLLFWLKDESKGFNRTDVFIEKSLKFSFDLTDSNVISSFIDLNKFVFSKA